MNSPLPTDSAERKEVPLHRGLLRYFPAALAGVARISKMGNDKHNPGEEMHHARGKSTDHGDCILRHLVDLDALLVDPQAAVDDILAEASCLAWRALALSQELHERWKAPVAPGARLATMPPTEAFEVTEAALEAPLSYRGQPLVMDSSLDAPEAGPVAWSARCPRCFCLPTEDHRPYCNG